MTKINIEYSKTLYESKTLRKVARAFLKVLPDNVDCLLSSGSSGCALASAMLAMTTRPLQHRYVRKPSDKGHCQHGGAYLWGNHQRYAIVDDIVASGATIIRIIEFAHEPPWDGQIVVILVGRRTLEGQNVEYHDVVSDIPVIEVEKLQ